MNTAPLPEFVETVRIGSHHEWVRWNHETNEYETANKYKRGYSHRVQNDYVQICHDCLPGKDWLKAHYQDTFPEATIEITVNPIGDVGQVATANWNGDYKKGVVRDFMRLYTTKVRIGRRNAVIDVGESDRRNE